MLAILWGVPLLTAALLIPAVSMAPSLETTDGQWVQRARRAVGELKGFAKGRLRALLRRSQQAWAGASGQGASRLPPALPGPFPLFPPDNWWNLDIRDAPLDPQSASFIDFVGPTRRLHPDFGPEEFPGSVKTYGFPYIVVDSKQPKKIVEFEYREESDAAGVAFYPIPDQAITQKHWIEGGEPGDDSKATGDRHLLIVDRDNRYLYELFAVRYSGNRWQAGSGAFFDLKQNARRPEGWTSADGAGLAILPGLVRYDEVHGPEEIRHAFRVTVRKTNGYVHPASHRAGSTPGALPMGARLRLKAPTDILRLPPPLQKIFRAMKTYGLIVADNGSDMYVSGTFDPRWDNAILNPAFHSLTAGDFEVVLLGYRGKEPARP